MRGLVAFLIMTGCAAAWGVGAGCEFYRHERLEMPAVTAEGEFLRWFNRLDAGMAEVCK